MQVHLKQAARSAEQRKDREDAQQERIGPASMSRQPLQPGNQPSASAQQAKLDTNSSLGQEQHAEGQRASSQQRQDYTSQYGQHAQHGQHARHVQYAQHGEAADGDGQHQQGRIQSVDGSKAAPAGRGFRQGGGEGVAAVLASGPPANMFSSPAPQVWAQLGTSDSCLQQQTAALGTIVCCCMEHASFRLQLHGT